MRNVWILAAALVLGILSVRWAKAGDNPWATQPSDVSSPPATQPDTRELQRRATDCQTALSRAKADCIHRLQQTDAYKSAAEDLQSAQQELDNATDSDSRLRAASDRMTAKEHLDSLAAHALATDEAVATASAAQRQAANNYQDALMQQSLDATLAQAKENLHADNPVDDDAVAEMLRRGEIQRLADIKTLMDDINQLNAQLVQIPETDHFTTRRNELWQSITKDRKLIATCQKLKGHYLPNLEMKLGSTGIINGPLHVFQVIDGNDMLLSFGEDSICWVKGFDTSGLVDDQEFEFHRALRITGTTQYNTAAGSTKTVFVVEPFGPENP